MRKKGGNGMRENIEVTKELQKQFNPKIQFYRVKLEQKKIYEISKRILDIVLSFIGLVVLSPLLLWIALKIYLDEPGQPIFFSQNRVGKNKRLFKIYKFRSMCVDAEKKLPALLYKNEVEGAMFKMKEDPRITKFGKFIRKTSMDELPQLWNVLKGDMSLVGPRPPLPREVAQYTPYDEQRLLVKPGCTGLWQINGRSNVNFSEMVSLDLEYIEKRSLSMDFKIIYRTVFVIFHPEGAC
ncbi:exopolysaccharide biosynthesis polyprenyl glycosylphosphotransferase [Enterococcus ratti]|uniref:Exopolysaccharide biosynthesis polyprenyl glycosylphosphotransferase n=2 Tax=Enterococcus ratti TaxID=150033 RepID=A0A1L8WKV7_9ENTE|nr:exopolysaccharide biosynthesis polyprenyl glycosylphosphotransferase [Enterococcus ratti]